MAREVRLSTPLRCEDVVDLNIGDVVYLSGIVYTARDLAHIRIMDYLREGKSPPEDFRGAALFHAGPVVRRKGDMWEVVGVGPTTSMRMEPFSETVLGRLGVKAIIGKGGMGENTLNALKRYCGVYLLSPPGCSVILSKAVRRVLRVHWLDLGIPEAIWVLEVELLGPLIVAMDSHGNSIFREVRERALTTLSRILRE